MEFPSSIAEFIKTEESNYQKQPIQVLDNVSWNMREHIQLSISMKYGWFTTASNDRKTKPYFKKIILPIMRVKYAARDIDVKDILLYVDDASKDHLSFLVKKFYDDVFVVEHNLDEFIDRAIEQKEDLGGTLVKKGSDGMPEVLPLENIAFCDQTNLLGGPIGLKLSFSPGSLRKMSQQGWGDEKNGATATIEDIIKQASQEKDSTLAENRSNKGTGKSIEVYVVRGEMPEHYLQGDKEDLVNQVQIVCFYTTKQGKSSAILYRQEEKEEIYKAYKTSAETIEGRALSQGGIEELIDDQTVTNMAEGYKLKALKSGSKNVLFTEDSSYANRNKIKDLEDNEVTVVEKGTQIGRVPTVSPAIPIFTELLAELENHARSLGGTLDPFPDGNATSGVPLGVIERIVTERRAPHKREQGKFAKWLEEIHRDWIIPGMMKEVFKGKEWFSTLSYEELDWLIERVACNQASKQITDAVLNGDIPPSYEELKQQIKDGYLKNGNRQLLKILKEEFKGVEVNIKINIAGKQKDIQFMSTALTNIAQTIAKNPAFRQDPLLNQMVMQLAEYAGLGSTSLVAPKPLPTNPQNAPQAQQVPAQQAAPAFAG